MLGSASSDVESSHTEIVIMAAAHLVAQTEPKSDPEAP